MKFIQGKPTVTILPETLNKIKKYTKLCEYSVYWLGKVIRVSNDFFIEDAMIIPQTIGKNGSIDFEKFAELEMLVESDSYEPFCLGRTKKGKSVAVTPQDMELLDLMSGETGYMIYIQTNTKDELSLTLVDYDKGIIFDDLSLTVADTEYFSDEEVMAEISINIELPKSRYNEKLNNFKNTAKTYLSKNGTEKSVEIFETDNGKKVVEIKGKEDTSVLKGQLVIEDKKVEKVVEKPVYVPNEFVTENIDFRLLVSEKGGEANDAT